MNYLHPHIEVRNTSGKGKGLFAKAKISRGDVIERTEDIQVLTKEQIRQLPDSHLWKSLCYEISNVEEVCPMDIHNPPLSFMMNHSCDPNVGSLSDFHTMVAIRDTQPGEELTYDYVMTDSGDYDMECLCGSAHCRKRITGNDWMNPELQERYKGFFQKNIQEKIDAHKPFETPLS